MNSHTEIRIWSAIGHTPITGRVGGYCDELVHLSTPQFETPEKAVAEVKRLLRETPDADTGYFNIPAWWNQNTRSGWVK